MTGYDIYESAMLKLGYLEGNGSIEKEESFKTAAKDCINEIGDDLNKMKPISKLTDILPIDNKYKSALSYGVAMLLSVLSEDEEKNKLFCEMYNLKRGCILAEKCFVKDNSPSIYGV